MVLNIIFSYNRALQLDYLLKSIMAQFSIDYQAVVIYHTTGEHKKGYELLIEKYSAYSNIEFKERKKVLFDLAYLPALRRARNRKFFFKKNFFTKNADNFKNLVQKTIRDSQCEFVMFNTDDGLFFKKVEIPTAIFAILRAHPEQASYRMYVGDNLEGMPAFVQKKGDYYEWDYYAEEIIHHWTFPFAVDGTVYHSKGLLKHLRKFAFNNPVSLEENGYAYMLKNKLFKTGLSPLHSNLVQTKLNRVSMDSLNPTIHIDPAYLNSKFLEGFSLELHLSKIIKNANLVPDEIILKHGELREVIYSLDDEGRKVQNLLGIEGPKEELE